MDRGKGKVQAQGWWKMYLVDNCEQYACKLSGRTEGTYTRDKSWRMAKHQQLHSSSKPNSSLLHNQRVSAYLWSLLPKGH